MPTVEHDYIKAVLDNIPDIAWLKDADGRFIWVNRAFAEAAGQDVTELIGKTDRDIWPPELADRYMTDDREVIRTGRRKIIEEPLLDAKDQPHWIETIKMPIYTDGGALIGTTGIARDITSRKSSEAALKAITEDFTVLLENTSDFVYFKDRNSRFRFCSQSLARLTGHSNWRDMIGKHDNEVFPEEMARIYSEEEVDVFRNGKPLLDKIDPYVDVRGKRGWVHTSKWPVFNGDGNEVVGIFGISRDISERQDADEQIRMLNAELATRAAELEAANRELEAFSYSVTHDLRKPLTVINGYCQAILQFWGDTVGDECRKYIGEIYDGTLRMNDLINAVLRFSQMSRGTLRREEVDLSAIAGKVAAELKLAETERDVTFIIPEKVSADGDSTLLDVVMENLLGNAWKYTGNRKEAVIEFGVQEVSGIPTYYVRDNGIGFHMSEAEKLFVPFQRLSGTAGFKGEGIGLATVERIITRHGGKIWAESEPGKGAVFYFQLAPRQAEEVRS